MLKTHPKYGFLPGTKPTIHYVYRGESKGVRVIKKVFCPSDDSTEAYSVDYYLDRFDELTKNIPGFTIVSKANGTPQDLKHMEMLNQK